jgi:FKBP-type peptidyl-prolyl cis-trans isomerase
LVTRVIIGVAALAVIALVIGAALVMKGAGAPAANPSPSPVAAKGSGKLEKTDINVGDGAEVKEGDTITVKYTGTLQDGTVFDSTDKHGGEPATFQLAKGSLIQGWVDGIPGMKVGGERKLVIPPDLGYGGNAQGSIPANSTLIFDITLVDVKPAS